MVQNTCDNAKIILITNANVLERFCTDSCRDISFNSEKLYLGRIVQIENAMASSINMLSISLDYLL